MIRELKASGGRIAVVAGPVVVHTGGSTHFQELIRSGFVDVLLAGNALAVHDVEHLRAFLLDRFSQRREIVSFRTSVVFQHSASTVVTPAVPSPGPSRVWGERSGEPRSGARWRWRWEPGPP